ncbi:MAG: hypothetical protein CMC70_08360 [Flavobacteriaceae bacterium]|nr:hypothetical protein [Flavobacteriaceae bacterium]
MSTNKSDELDLMFLYQKVKDAYKAILLGLYRWVVFLIKFWYVALLVILIGYGIGYYQEKNAVKLKETTVLVQLSFDSVDYVYNDIVSLKRKINEGDASALGEVKEYHGDLFKIGNIAIEPLQDVRDLATGVESNNRNVDVFLDLSKYEEDLLLSDMFLSQYKLHKITITATREAGKGAITGVLAYLNSNKHYDVIKENGIKNLNLELDGMKKSITAIDSILYGISKVRQDGSQTYVNTSSVVNLHSLVQEKTKLIKDIQYLETDILRAKEGIVSVINKPQFQRTASFFDSKSKIYPVVFFIFFLITVSLISLFKKLKKEDEVSKK